MSREMVAWVQVIPIFSRRSSSISWVSMSSRSMISKILLMAVFAGIYVLTGVIGKQRLWLAVLLSLGVGMFLFNIIPTVTPLDATFMNVILCLVGGVLLGGGLGVVSRAVLDHFDIL